MLKKPQKPGSALLITLLLLTVASSLILVGTRAMINSTRVGALTSDTQAAYLAAESGLQEGLLRLKSMAPDAEYGYSNITQPNIPGSEPGFLFNITLGFIGDPSYSLLAMERNFQGNKCDLLSNDALPNISLEFSRDCPAYRLAIRRNVGINLKTQNQNFLTSQDFYNGIANLTVSQYPSGPGTVSLIPHFSNPGDSLTCEFGCMFSGPYGDGQPITIFSSPIRLVLAQGSVISSEGVKISGMEGSFFLVSKDYVTIESTGLAGGVEKKFLLLVRPDGTREVYDFAGQIDTMGVWNGNTY